MIQTADISGMGMDFEEYCQLLLTGGLLFIADCPSFDVSRDHNSKEIRKEFFELSLVEHAELHMKSGGPSGSQLGAVYSHLAAIQRYGYDKWLHDMEATDKGRVVDLVDENREAILGRLVPLFGSEDGKEAEQS